MSRERKALARNQRIEQLKNQKYDRFQLRDLENALKPIDEKTERITPRKLLKKICLVLTDKANTNGTMTSAAFAAITSIVFKIIACLGFWIVAAGIWVLYTQVKGMTWADICLILKNMYAIMMLVMLLLIVFLYSVIMWGSSNEIKREQDKNYIVSVFSGVVSFAALIVALVALVKG